MKKPRLLELATALGLASLMALPPATFASSHMDAPLITFDDAANTTDVYAFVSQRDGQKYLTAALSVYPFEEPGIGPNKFNFDDNVLYQIHVCTGRELTNGFPSISYQFQFKTTYKTTGTILQSYLGVINDVGDAAQNLVQTYTVNRLDYSPRGRVNTVLGTGTVPPNNQGIATPLYNQGNNGENPEKPGVSTAAQLDRYTTQGIVPLARNYRAFAGQRDDGFYGDIQAIFDLLQLRNPGRDAQAGFNVHTIVLEIPLNELGGDQQVVGVFATTSRPKTTVLRDFTDCATCPPVSVGNWVQVGRQGNPLFCEALVAIADKDLYNRTNPQQDRQLFQKYALSPELAGLLNVLVLGAPVAPTSNRTDIAGIFIPDTIKVDLSTAPARLAGGGIAHPTTPDDSGFSRLGIFGGDVLTSSVQAGFGGGTVPGGWPNGRRFGDDVIDIAVTALISDLRTSPPTIVGPAGDNVDANEAPYNKVFPYAGTPNNGRTRSHP